MRIDTHRSKTGVSIIITHHKDSYVAAAGSPLAADKGALVGVLAGTSSGTIQLTKDETAALGYALLDIAGEVY